MGEIAKVESNAVTPAEMIKLAISGGADLDKLEKLLTLQERYEAMEAKKAYHQAMALFKSNPPKIDKDRKVSFNQTKYNYASLANVTEKISAELSKYGLSASWTIKQNGFISVTCKITHNKGHSEETTITAEADKSGSKNSIQAIGSTITYLERYTLLALTGLATEDMDDDGKNSELEYITTEQGNKILDYVAEMKTPKILDKLFKYLQVESLEKMPKSKFMQAVKALEEAKAQEQKAQVKK